MASDPGYFRDEAESSGLRFTHFNGMTGAFLFPEMTGQGGAVVDYDGDGDLDVYLVQGGLLGSGVRIGDAIMPPAEGSPEGDRLFRNDSFMSTRAGHDLTFSDVTETAGIEAIGFGMGVAVGDIDSDGWPDLYVTNYGPNQLLRNRGDGTFEDRTEISGTGDRLWGTSATFFDYDADGDDDLYVANYVTFDIDANPRCFAPSSRRDYCGPAAFQAQPDRLYENRGDGVFNDVTSRALVGYEPGPGLGVVAADFNGDGHIDLYVANDGTVNQMWINQGNRTFVDDALFAGVALNAEGKPEASMGVAVEDFDTDGDVDIFLTHLTGESNTLYVNDGNGLFVDRTVQSGLAGVSLPYTSFGTSWVDVDGDGRLDLFAANGAVRILEDQAGGGDPYPLKQPNQLFRNLGGIFEDVSSENGAIEGAPAVSRGLARGDIDNDGAPDILVFNNSGPTQLLINDRASTAAWMGLTAAPPKSSNGLVGYRFNLDRGADEVPRPRAESDARVGDLSTGWERSAVRAHWRRAHIDGSYCSANDPRVIFGLGEISVRPATGPADLTLRTDVGATSVRIYRGVSPIGELKALPLRRYVVIDLDRIGPRS